jgi:hypothetical protein
MTRVKMLWWSACLIPLMALDPTIAASPKRPRFRPPVVKVSVPVKPNTFEGAEPGDDKVKIKLSEDGKTIFVAGEMVFGTYRKFARVLKSAPAVRTVHLGSPGGIVLEGFLMSALVRERRLNTYVETFCSSSCTQVLVAGIDRAAAPLAKVGFHASAYVEDEDEPSTNISEPAPLVSGDKSTDKNAAIAPVAVVNSPPDENDDLVFKSSFVRTGVEQGFITRAFTTPHADIWYPSIAEMVTARVLTRTSTGNEIPVAPGIGMARTALETDLLKRPLWQQAKALRPAAFEASILEAVRVSQIGTSDEDVVKTANTELGDRLADEFATAPTAILDSIAVLARDQMSADPLDYFTSCYLAAGAKKDREPTKMPLLDQREEDLMISLMQSRERGKPLSYAKSGRLITKLLVTRTSEDEASEDAQTCKDAKSLLNAIADLPSKKRGEAYRALMVYGGDESEE